MDPTFLRTVSRLRYDRGDVHRHLAPKWDGDIWSDTDEYRRLGVVLDFVRDAIALLDKYNPKPYKLRHRGDRRPHQDDYYDRISGMLFEIIFASGYIKGPVDLCWSVQHNSIWSAVFWQADSKFGRSCGSNFAASYMTKSFTFRNFQILSRHAFSDIPSWSWESPLGIGVISIEPRTRFERSLLVG